MLRFVFFFLLGLLLSGSVLAQSDEGIRPEGKTADYYRILLKRPRPGYLFDRFFNSWLEQQDIQALEQFLEQSEDEGADALLAFYYESVHELEKASGVYSELIETRPDWLDLLYYRASVDALRGFNADAVESLNILLEQTPSRDLQLKALKLLGRCQMRLGGQKEGLAAWERLLVVSGNDIDVAEELLDLQLAEGLYEEALANCDTLLAQTSDAFQKIQLRMRRATILVRLDRRSDAVEALRAAYGLTGQGAWLQRDVLARIEQLYRGADDLSGLCSCYQAMLVQYAKQPVLLQAYAEALAADGQPAESLETARAVLRMVPNDRELKEWYLELLIDRGDWEDAVGQVEQLMERYPDDNELRLQLADLYQLIEEDEKSIVWLLAFLEHSKKAEADYLRTARQLARYGFDNEATSVLTFLLSEQPDSAAGREALALHLTRKGYLQLQLAWPQYEWLATSGDLETLLRLASALQVVGKAESAYDLLKMRADDFGGDYRYVCAAGEMTRALEMKEKTLEYGLKRIALAQTAQDLEMACASMVMELKSQELMQEWVDRLKEKPSPAVEEVWLLAMLLQNQKESDEARQCVVAALQAHPGNVLLLQCRLMLAEREHDWAIAESVLLTLVEQQPQSQSSWVRELVPILLRSGKTDEALEWVEVLKKNSPYAVRPYELERDVLLAANRQNDAVLAMRSAVQRFDESKELKMALGRLYERSGRLLEAEQLYWRMLNAEETLDARLNYLTDIIRVSQSNGRFNVLTEALKRRSENSKTAVFPLLGLAECYRIRNRENERKAVMAELLDLRPNDVTILRTSARLEEDLGNYETARNLMERIAKMDSTGSALSALAEYEFLYGDRNRAQQWMADPRMAQDPDKVLDVYTTLIEKGCVSPVLEFFAKPVGGMEMDWRFDYLHAVALEENNQQEEAIAALLALLKVDTELTETTPATSVPLAVRQLIERQNLLADYMPEELMLVLDSRNFERQAYAYKPSNNNRRYMMQGSGWMPSNEGMLKGFTLAHLSRVCKSIPADEQDGLWARVEEELPYGSLLQIDENGGINNAEWWNAATERYPDSKELRMMRLVVAGHTVETEEAVRSAVDEFSEESPELVRLILLSALNKYPQLVDLMEGVADDLMDNDQNLQLALYTLRTAITQITDDKPLSPAMLQLAALIRSTSENGDTLSVPLKDMAYLLAVVAEQDCEAVVVASQDIFHGKRTFQYGMLPASTGGIRHYFGRRALLLEFPPTQLLDGQLQGIAMLKTIPGIAPPPLEAAVRNIDGDPLFRLLALGNLEVEQKELKPFVEELERNPIKSPNDLWVLASWYQTAQPEKALDYLLELWALKAARVHQPKVTEILLSSAALLPALSSDQEIKLKAVVANPLASKGNQALQALMLDMMDRLGLPMESLVSNSQAASAGIARLQPRTSTSQRTDPYQRFRKNIDAGMTEQGLRQLAVLLRKEALKAIYPQAANTSQTTYVVRNCINLIKQKNLQSQLLANFPVPESDTQARAWFEYAYVCDLLDQRKEALAAYQKVAESRPEWRGVLNRQISLLAIDDPAEAQRLMEGLPAAENANIATAIMEKVNNNTLSLDERMVLFDCMVGTASDLSFQSIHNLRNTLQNHWYYKGKNLPGLFDASEAGVLGEEWEEPKILQGNLKYLQDESLKEIQQQRRECYIALCLAMAEKEPSTLLGFRSLTAYLDYTDAPVDRTDLLQLAEKTLRGRRGGQNYYHNSNEPGRSATPLEFYVIELRRLNRLDEAMALLDELPEGDENRKALALLLALQAAETKEEYLGSMQDVLNLSNTRMSSGSIEAAMQLHQLDGRAFDIDEVIWQHVYKLGEQGRIQESATILRTMMMMNLDETDTEAVAGVINRFLKESLTDAERQTLTNAAPGSISNSNQPKLYNKYHQISGVIQPLAINAQVFKALYPQLNELDRFVQHGGMANNLINKQLNQPVSLEGLRQLGFTGEWPGFQVYLYQNQQYSMLNQMLQRLDSDTKTALLAELNEMDPPTFGAGLLIPLLENNNRSEWPRNVMVYLASSPDFLAAAPERQAEFFEWILAMEHQNRSTVDARDEDEQSVQSLVAQYKTWRLNRALEYRDELIQSSIASIMRDRSTWQNKWRAVSASLMEHNPAEAVQFYLDMDRRIKLVGHVQGQAQDDRNNLQQIFNNASYSENERTVMAQVVNALNSESARKWYRENYVNQMCYRMADQLQRKGMEYQEAREQVARELMTLTLSSGSDDGLDILKNALSQVDRKKHTDLAKWLDDQSFPDTALRRVTQIYLGVQDSDEAWLKTFFVDEAFSSTFRLQTYGWLATRRNSPAVLAQPEVVWPLVDLMDQEPDLQLPDAAFSSLLKSTTAEEQDEVQTRRAEQLFRLWNTDRVAGSKNDRRMLYLLVDLAAEAGMDEQAITLLRAETLSRYPQTYAVALRSGYDEFVANQLPSGILRINNSFSSSQGWIPTNSVAACEAIANGIDDAELRLIYQLFFARLPIKEDGDIKANDTDIERYLAEASETMVDPEMMRWVIRIFNRGNTKKHMDTLNLRYSKQADLLEVLQRNESQEIEAYAMYVGQLAVNRDVEALREIVASMWKNLDENQRKNHAQRWLFKSLFITAGVENRLNPAASPATGESEDFGKVFFSKDGWPAGFQTEAFIWLSNQGNNRPGFIDDPEFILSVIDLIDGKDSAMFPVNAFVAQLNLYEKMEPGTEKDRIKELCTRFATRVDVIALFKNSSIPRAECAACESYIQKIDPENEYTVLEKWLSAIASQPAGSIEFKQHNYVFRRRLLQCLIREALLSKRPELIDCAVKAANKVRIYGAANGSQTQGQVYRQHGVVVFDPVIMELDDVDPVQRMLAYDTFEKEFEIGIAERMNRSSDVLKRQGIEHYAAWQQARMQLMDEWMASAGKDGLVPLYLSLIKKGMWLEWRKAEELDELATFVRCKELDSLMRDQCLALLAMSKISKTKGVDVAEAMDDVKRYLARTDLDPVERLRFCQILNRPDRRCIEALDLKVSKHREIYTQIADGLTQLLKQKSQVEIESRTYSPLIERLVLVLFALDRNTEALEWLERDGLAFASRPAMFLVAVEAGELEWCTQHLAMPVLSYVFGRRNYTEVPDSAALARVIAGCKDPDLQLTAEIFFSALGNSGDAQKAGLKSLARKFLQHEFTDPLCEAQARSLLERKGILVKTEVDPYAMTWVNERGIERLIPYLKEGDSIERMMFSKYINGLMDSGEIDVVCGIYDKLLRSDFDRTTSQWLVTFPFEGGRLPKMGSNTNGAPVVVSGRYRNADLKAWYRLGVAANKVSEKNQSSYMGSRATAAVNVSTCIILGQPDRLYELRYDEVNGYTFRTFAAFSGVYDDGADEALLEKALMDYYAGVKYYKAENRPSNIGHLKWLDVARWVLETYPYCDDLDTWVPVVQELSPEKFETSTLLEKDDKK